MADKGGKGKAAAPAKKDGGKSRPSAVWGADYQLEVNGKWCWNRGLDVQETLARSLFKKENCPRLFFFLSPCGMRGFGGTYYHVLVVPSMRAVQERKPLRALRVFLFFLVL